MSQDELFLARVEESDLAVAIAASLVVESFAAEGVAADPPASGRATNPGEPAELFEPEPESTTAGYTTVLPGAPYVFNTYIYTSLPAPAPGSICVPLGLPAVRPAERAGVRARAQGAAAAASLGTGLPGSGGGSPASEAIPAAGPAVLATPVRAPGYSVAARDRRAAELGRLPGDRRWYVVWAVQGSDRWAGLHTGLRPQAYQGLFALAGGNFGGLRWRRADGCGEGLAEFRGQRGFWDREAPLYEW